MVDEPLHGIENVAELTRGSRHRRDADGAALPLVLVIHLGDRDVEPVAEPVDDRADRRPLGLERPALRDVEVEADRGRVHVPIFAPVRVRDGPRQAGSSTTTGISRSVLDWYEP